VTPLRAAATDGGVGFEVNLDRGDLLPGRLTSGTVRLAFRNALEIRGIVASLIATEQWQWHRTNHVDGRTTTETVTEKHELQRLPVRLDGPGRHAGGETRDYRLELPVPPLGPATFEGTVSRLTWKIEVKLDVPGFDPSIELDVVVLQPTGLLSAGVIDLGQFALWPSADAASGDARASIMLTPVPLCVGAAFRGVVSLTTPETNLQEIRLELRANVAATVSNGLEEEITLWTGPLRGGGAFGGADRALPFDGELAAPPWLPTVRLPHGRSDAQFHVILAKSLARDTHLVRDVAVCSTTEL
jgi:hypothetical protein